MVNNFRTYVRFGTALATGLVLLAACDQRGERVDRARGVVEAAMDQLNGRDTDRRDPEAAMKRASLVDRALAGTIRNEVRVHPDALRTRFAVGSIICKPRETELVPLVAMEAPQLSIEEPIVVEGPIEAETPERTITGERRPLPVLRDGTSEPVLRDVIRDPVLERRLPDRSLTTDRDVDVYERDEEVTSTPQAPTRSLPAPVIDYEHQKMARRAVVSQRSLVVRETARDRMLNTMDKYGLGGDIAISRGGQMIIQLDGTDPTQLNGNDLIQVGETELAYLNEEGCPDNVAIETVRQNAALATECVVEELLLSGDFEYVERDFIFTNQFAKRPPDVDTAVFKAPDDPLWGMQWHFKNNGSEEGQSLGGAGFEDFWSRKSNQGSRDVVVAVIDTGLQMEHPDIKDSPNVAAGWDMVSDPRMGNDGDGRDPDANDPGDLCDPNVPFAENSYHGTHVAGTIGAAATNNGAGVAGGAWNVTIVPVRALGKCGGRLSDINDAIRWAGGLIPAIDAESNEVWNENPADIINLSIGLFQLCPASLQDAIDSVTERGVIVVAAAGNARISTQYYAPGGCNNVISVAAGDARGQIAPYSNYGAEVDVLAPGGDLMRDDNGDGRPDGVLSTKLSTDCFDPVTGDPVAECYYAYEQGTSMAAPHVSAALALLESNYPSKNSAEIQALLLAALDHREPLQCAGLCSQYPGAAPIEGSADMCLRPCGGGLLNLANIANE